jgi:Lrp/AsnC family transcriptional regulator, leucine-responsive regulatory protein
MPAGMRRSVKLDAVDRRIVSELQRDARLAMPILAERAGVSAPACYRRVRRLRETGVIEREIAVVAPRTLGWPLSMIVLVTLDREDSRTADRIRRKLEVESAVIEAWQITGEYDFAVRIIARDMEDYDALTHRIFVQDENVRSFKTLVVFRQTKAAAAIPSAEDVD